MSRIKESSDELNPPVAVKGAAVAPAAKGSPAANVLALSIATCGVGYIPAAPGTWGAMVGAALYLALRSVILKLYSAPPMNGRGNDVEIETIYMAAMLVLTAAVTLLGVWAGTRAEKLLGRKDPGKVVVDEVAGQLITFLFVPINAPLNWWIVLAGFLLFRLFDIWKPYPARRMEVLESGLGIMADDVVAGAYAAMAVALMVAVNQLI